MKKYDASENPELERVWQVVDGLRIDTDTEKLELRRYEVMKVVLNALLQKTNRSESPYELVDRAMEIANYAVVRMVLPDDMTMHNLSIKRIFEEIAI